MKRIFPIISFLILLSLLGLIFFQFLWLKTAKEIKEQQLRNNVTEAVHEAANKLVEDAMVLPKQKKSDLLFPNDKLKMDLFTPSVIQRYSKDEIHGILKKSLENHFLKDVDFEFAVIQNSITGDQIHSENFF